MNKYHKNEEGDKNINDNNDNNIHKNPTLRNSSILNKNTMKSNGGEDLFFGIIEGKGTNALKKDDIMDAYIDGAESEIQTKVK